ncbi:MAG TPA: multicopper oxidase family protein [Candidatus Cybelea sp.]|jgi:FtsP/CotA-like multicopper oxidase with cupredoxin domain
MPTTRGRFLTTLGGAGAALATVGPLERALAVTQRTTLIVTTSTVEVLGRTVERLDIVQPNGTRGIETVLGSRFRVQLVNRLTKPTLIHWHGLILPPHQDGVPIISQPALRPYRVYQYDFPLVESRTYWMHSHEGLQEQSLLSAPLIIADPADAGRDEQQVVAEIADFSFREPEEIFAELRAPKPIASAVTPGGMKPDVNDVNYDAFLINRRPIENPEVFRIERRARILLRIINSASSTNFTIDLGSLRGTLVAVDGRPIEPVQGSRFPIGIANRCDIRIETPSAGVYPIFAVREADSARAAFVLASPGAAIPRYAAKGEFTAPLNTLILEEQLRAVNPLSVRPADRHLTMALTGDMSRYSWSIDNVVWTDDLARSTRYPFLPVKRGGRVEITMVNKTMMSHPMHLHGHAFQIVAVNGRRFPGALRDTILVTAKTSVTFAFDANNPGWWFFHCHNLYHLAAGMATSLKYVS